MIPVFTVLLLVPSLAFAATVEPPRPDLDMLGVNALGQMLLGLLLVLVLLAGLVWLLRRYTPLRSGEGNLKLIAGLAVGTRERVVLIEVGGTRLLLGVAPGRVQTLQVFQDPARDAFTKSLAAAKEGTYHRGANTIAQE